MEIKYVKTICPFCGSGCSLNLVVKDGAVCDVQPSQRGPVNDGKLCRKGHMCWEFVGSKERVTQPMIRDASSGQLKPASWDEALSLIAKKFGECKPDEAAFITAATASNEDVYALQKLARAGLKTSNIDNSARDATIAASLGIGTVFGNCGSTNPYNDLASSECIILFGSYRNGTLPVAGRKILQAKENGGHFVVCSTKVTSISRLSDLHVLYNPNTEVQLLNCLMKQIIERGMVDEEFIKGRTSGYDELKKCVTQDKYSIENTTAICGTSADTIEELLTLIKDHKHKTAFVLAPSHSHMPVGQSVAFIQTILGNIGKSGCGVVSLKAGGCNTQGACDMGALVEMYPGYRPVTDAKQIKDISSKWGVDSLPTTVGLTFSGILYDCLKADSSKIKSIYIMDNSPEMPSMTMTCFADQKGVKKGDRFVVMQSAYTHAPSAYLADVVLPAACFAEEDGTVTNAERRVQRIRKAADAPGEAKANWEIVKMVADKLGCGKSFAWNSSEEVFNEIKSVVPHYAGITYAKLEGDGVQWPCATEEDIGKAILHTEEFPCMSDKKAKLSAVEYIPTDCSVSSEYPFILATGTTEHSCIGQCHSHNIDNCCCNSNESKCDGHEFHPWVEMNPDDAVTLNIKDKDHATMTNRKGEIVVHVNVTPAVKKGVVLIVAPFIFMNAMFEAIPSFDSKSNTMEFKNCAVNLKKLDMPENKEA